MLCCCPCEECLSVCPWCVCAVCASQWGVPSPVCAPQHGQCVPKGTADPFGGLKDRRTRILHAADGQHSTHSVSESVDAVVWSDGGVSKQTPILEINLPVFFPFHSVLLQCYQRPGMSLFSEVRTLAAHMLSVSKSREKLII